MAKSISDELRDLQRSVEKAARGYGLDGFECIYEMLDYDEINMVAAYGGFPVRYPHWRWGMEYDRLKKGYEYGINKIYEMVINNDPCYAYLMESNSYVDQKIVMCHVSAHNDFFKNNLAFAHTNRSMINEMANHASRIRRYMDLHGTDEVESFIDRVLSLENLIDINAPYITRKKGEGTGRTDANINLFPVTREYMEPYVNPDSYIEGQRLHQQKEKERREQSFPEEPRQDVLQFLLEHAPLKGWQADIVDIIREEAYYFVPQAMTKIMNEGWASYWHAKLMTTRLMEPSEIIDFADRHSAVMMGNSHRLNPYKLGMELFRDIEERWNSGRFGVEWESCGEMAQKNNWNKNCNLGAQKIFEVRRVYSDLMFIDEFLTMEICQRQGLFSYGFDKGQAMVIESRDFDVIKKKLLASLTNLGHPCVRVINGNYENRAELLLEHVFSGIELDLRFAKETLKNLAHIWSRPVHIITEIDNRKICLSHDGENYAENILTVQV